VAEAKKGLEASPDFPPFALLLGSALAAAGQYEEAAQALAHYQELLPEEPNAHGATGRLRLKQGDFQQATAAFERALHLDPQYYPAYLGLSTCLLLQNKPAKAREQAQLLYETAPSDDIRRQALFASGAAYVDEDKYDKAIEEAQKRLELAQKARNLEGEAADHHLIGDLWLAAGNPAEGQASYRRAWELIEKSALKPEVKSQARREYLWREAIVSLEKKDLATARKKTEEYRQQAEARKNAGDIQRAYLLQGLLALEEKRPEAALQELEQADPHNPRTHYALGNTYQAMGDKARARLSWANAAQFNELQYDYLIFRRKVKI
jgi:tetratricopeptide (TPR) repeat protein